ncbi:hypothetical protein AC578_6591 [Pseudocercospora eumusae]|uniref:Uncharacterized protein n=1 Tax=Pseudocercospora eumusae TaxID=321146 RepID=A0A139GW13_9PEZI|nr:hypothetical protein AC578_6591 [Pseudocercospora eumusae]
MAPKRSSTDAGIELPSRTRHSAKRPRRTSDHENSSECESSTPSSASDLESSPVASAETAATSTSSIASSVSSDSESSDEHSSESEDESDSEDELNNDQGPEIITIRPPTSRPSIDPARLKSYAKELQARLDEFMPRLRQANSDLAAKGSNLSMEDVAEGEQHIEMNLGLGVLEQKDDQNNKPGDIAVRAEAKPSSSDDEDDASDGEADVMSRLMNAPATKGRISVQEVPAVDEQ